MTDFQSIEPEQFIKIMNEGELGEAVVIDVREQMEWDYYHLERTILMPMNTIPSRLNELPPEQPIYVLCAHGVRSAAVCQYLSRNGRDNAINVEGGMAAVSQLLGFQYD